jgi:hypothetical protein
MAYGVWQVWIYNNKMLYCMCKNVGALGEY